jgi:ABC-type transporter Mla subunit MlaD
MSKRLNILLLVVCLTGSVVSFVLILWAVTASSTGKMQFTDTASLAQAYYRTTLTP